MTETNAPTVKLPDNITVCPICSGPFKDPRSLPCLHVYCSNCLSVVSRDKNPGEKIPCPVCATEFSLPEGGPSGLPKNLLLERLLHIKQLSSTNRTSSVCDECATDEEAEMESKAVASKYCVQCQEKLCEDCAKLHSKNKMLRSHKLIDMDDVTALQEEDTFRASLPITCQKHSDQTLTIYCSDCQAAICQTCFFTAHKQHACSLISDVVTKFQQQMASDVSNLEKGVNKLAVMLTSVEQQKEDFVERVAEAEDAIFKKTEEMKQLLERNKETLINELATKKAEVLKQATDVSGMIAWRISLMESIKQYTQELSSKGAADYVAREISAVHSRVEELLKCHQIERSRDDMDSINVQFTESVTPTSADYSLVGKIAVKVVAKVIQAAPPKVAETVTVAVPKRNSKQALNLNS